MNVLREVAGGLLKMFVGDAVLTVGILTVVSLAGSLTRTGAVPPLVGGATLFLGSIVVLVASVVLSSRRLRSKTAIVADAGRSSGARQHDPR
jgi:hypothetical protein